MAFLAQGTERREGFGALLLELSHGSAEERALRTHLKWTRDAWLTDAKGGEGRGTREEATYGPPLYCRVSLVVLTQISAEGSTYSFDSHSSYAIKQV